MFNIKKMFANRTTSTATTTMTITTQEVYEKSEKIKNNGKKKLYLVLKQRKSFAQEIIDEIQQEINKRFAMFIKNRIGKLMQAKPDNPDLFLKYFLVKAYIKILTEILEEYKMELSEKDKKIFLDIMNSPEQEDEKDDNEIDKNRDMNGKNSNNPSH